jgi:hypothetical protein
MNSDRINPIVIKELRQGLKSRSFLLTFVGLQIAMVISMFTYLTTVLSDYGDLDGPDGFFWGMIGLMLALLMPLRAFNALYEEQKENTLELIFLTRMTAWKIAFGKWVALTIQMLLMVSAILPYFVLRYFLGSIDIAENLLILTFSILSSAVLIALGVGLSAFQSRILRVALLIGAILGVMSAAGSFVSYIIYSSFAGGGSSSGPTLDWLVWGVYVVMAVVLIIYFVEFGAARIAPPAENHAVVKRMLAFLLLAVFGVFAFVEDEAEIMFFTFFLLGPLCVGALCEPVLFIPTRYKFGRKLPGLKWLFYPGWPSGWLFVTVLFSVDALLISILDFDEDLFLMLFAMYNVLLFPFVLIRLIPPLERNALVSYFAIQVTTFILSLMSITLSESGIADDGMSEFFGVFFPILGMMVSFDSRNDLQYLFPVVSLVYVIIIILRIKAPLWDIRQLIEASKFVADAED